MTSRAFISLLAALGFGYAVAVHAETGLDDLRSAVQSAGSMGSGLVIQSGLVITCSHVIEEATTIKVLVDGELHDATIAADDPANDVAVLKLKTTVPGYPLSRPAFLKLGSPVFTLGFPNPAMQGIDIKYTGGEISGLKGILDDPRSMQISVPIQPGNSGGPLFDESGNLVGIVEAKLNESMALRRTGALPQNVGYAIKTSYVEPLLATIEGYEPAVAPAPAPTDRATLIAGLQKHVAMILTFGRPDVGPQPFSDAAVAEFVRRFVESGHGPAEAQLPFYADRVVEYFGETNLDHRAILEDRRTYVAKWPQRKFLLTEEPAVVERTEDGTIVAIAKFQYQVRNASRATSGEGVNVIGLRQMGDRLKIVWVGEKVKPVDPLASRLAAYVIDFLRAGDSNSPEGQLSFYADRVRYFDEGIKTRAQILQDQKEYEAKWPKRSHEILSAPVVEQIGEGLYRVRIKCEFVVGSEGRHRTVTGISEVELSTTRGESRGMITSVALNDVVVEGS